MTQSEARCPKASKILTHPAHVVNRGRNEFITKPMIFDLKKLQKKLETAPAVENDIGDWERWALLGTVTDGLFAPAEELRSSDLVLLPAKSQWFMSICKEIDIIEALPVIVGSCPARVYAVMTVKENPHSPTAA